MSAYKHFNKEFRQKSLIKTYQKHIEESTAVGIDKIGRDKFKEEYLDHIRIINKKVNNDTYNFSPYRKKLISKGEGEYPRVISIPTFRDRVTLRTLCNVLSITFKDDLHLEIPQAKLAYINLNIKNHEYDSYLKIDVSNFYPTVNHDILIKTLKKRIRKVQFINLIDKAIKNITVNKSKKEKMGSNSCGVPQGLSISNVLAEIYLLGIDKKYNKYSSIFYTRYVDDILIFCKSDEVEDIFSNIKDDFKSIFLEIHELNKVDSKCQSGHINNEIHFLGYNYINRKSTLIQNNKERFQDSVANLLTTFKYRYNSNKNKKSRDNSVKVLEWRLNLRITGCIFNNNKRGWMFYFSQIEDLTALYTIDATIAKLVARFCPVKIKVKSLVKTYHETKRLKTSSHKYITNFDTLTIKDKRDILEKYLGFDRLSRADDETIEKYFNMRITHIIQELEQDIGNVS